MYALTGHPLFPRRIGSVGRPAWVLAALGMVPPALAAAAPGLPWPDTPLARLEALALIQTLNSQILASPSATRSLQNWCRAHALAEPPQIVAHPLPARGGARDLPARHSRLCPSPTARCRALGARVTHDEVNIPVPHRTAGHDGLPRAGGRGQAECRWAQGARGFPACYCLQGLG